MHASATSVYAKQSKKCDPDRVCQGVDIVRCRKNALANAPFPLPVFCLLDNIRPAEEGHLADLTFVRKKEDRRAGLAGRLPYVGPGWYGKPATAFMLDARQLGGLRVVPGRHRPRLAGLPRPGTGDHGAGLARGRGAHGQARRQRSHRTLGPVQGRLLLHAHVQSRGGRPALPVSAGLLPRPGPVPLRPRQRHGALLQPLHAARPRFRHGFGVCGDGEDPPGPARGAASLPGGDEDRLPGLSEPSAEVPAHGGGADQAAPPGQHAEVSLRGGEAIGGRVPGAAAGDGAADGAGALAPRGGSRGALPQRPQPLVVRHAGHGQDAPGEADRVAALAARRRGHPDLQDALQRAEPRVGGADGGPLGAQDHPRGALLAGLAGGRGGHAARRGAVGRHRRALHEPPGPVSAARRLPTVTGGAGRLRRGPGAADSEGVPAAARPGLRLRARAHGEPAQRREDLSLPAVPESRRGRAGAAAGRRAGGPGAVPHARGAGHLPGHLARPSDGHQRPGEPAARAGGGGGAGAPGAGSRRDEPATDHAPVARAQARGGRWEGAQGVLRDGFRAVLHARRAPAQHAPLPRHHLRLVPGADAPRARVALRHAQPALQREASLRRCEPLHRRGAGLKPGISRDGMLQESYREAINLYCLLCKKVVVPQPSTKPCALLSQTLGNRCWSVARSNFIRTCFGEFYHPCLHFANHGS